MQIINPQEVKRVMEVLSKRFEKYKLELHADKTTVVHLGNRRGEGNRSFDFLGFTHYLGESLKGYPVLKRKTSSKKFTLSISKVYQWIKASRHRKLSELVGELNVKLRGYYNYYGITFNSRSIGKYHKVVVRILFKWINCRGGKRVWPWSRYEKLINVWIPLLKPRIYHSYFSVKPIYEEPDAGKPLVRVCEGTGR